MFKPSPTVFGTLLLALFAFPMANAADGIKEDTLKIQAGKKEIAQDVKDIR